MIISTTTTKAHTFDKIHLLIKSLGKLEIEGKSFNMLRGTCKNPAATIIRNGRD